VPVLASPCERVHVGVVSLFVPYRDFMCPILCHFQWPARTTKNLSLSCRVVELSLEVLFTTLSQVLDSLPPVLTTPATLPPNWLEFFMCK